MGVLKVWDGTQWVESAGATGDVNGPSSSTDNAIARWDGTTGKLLQDSVVDLADDGTITGKVLAPFTVKASAGEKLLVQGGAGSATAAGGDAELEGGKGGSTSGNGGDVVVTGGDPLTSGDGGNALVKGGAGAGTNKAGGNVVITAGEPTGSGTAGVIHATDDFAWSNKTEGGTGRVTRRTSHETHTLAAAGTSDTTTISIPSGARLLSVQMNVNTAVVHSGVGNNWDAAFITGSTTSIVSSGANAPQNSKVDFIVPDEKTTAVAEVQFSTRPGGNTFSAGVIEIVAYYEELTSLADV